MTKKRASLFLTTATALGGLLVAPALAHATSDGAPATSQAARVERVHPLTVADVVVNGAPAAEPVPAVVPVAPAPTPIVEAPAHTSQTTVVEHEQRNYMTTVAVSALMGGVAGALVGGSLYFLADNQEHASRIGYWAAGGVLVGAAVGVTQVVVQEGRVERTTADRLPSDPAPTFRLALVNTTF